MANTPKPEPNRPKPTKSPNPKPTPPPDRYIKEGEDPKKQKHKFPK